MEFCIIFVSEPVKMTIPVIHAALRSCEPRSNRASGPKGTSAPVLSLRVPVNVYSSWQQVMEEGGRLGCALCPCLGLCPCLCPCLCLWLCLWGRFRTARTRYYYVAYPVNTPENHPPTEACMINSKQHRGCRIQDPGTRGKHQTSKKKSLVYQQAL